MDNRRSSRAYISDGSTDDVYPAEDDTYQRRLSGPLNSHPPNVPRDGRSSRLSQASSAEGSDLDEVSGYHHLAARIADDSEDSVSEGDAAPGAQSLDGFAPAILRLNLTNVSGSMGAGSIDIMNDPRYDPPLEPTDTQTSATLSLGTSSEKAETCRICRCEGTAEEPLFHPCKCSGSIKFVHQECLMEWLSHSKKKHCELCKTPFHFTKLYDANMPKNLPWFIFVQRAFLHFFGLCLRVIRLSIVGSTWMVVLPWFIRWAWRWMFWLADAGWAREEFIRISRVETAEGIAGATESNATSSFRMFKPESFFNAIFAQNSTTSIATGHVRTRTDASVLSSWTYLSQLTSSPGMNRVILDVFEGQLVTCLVITGFILVFLIREWVVQQQPLAHLENLRAANVQLHAAAERIQAQNERMRRQTELERWQQELSEHEQVRAERGRQLESRLEAHAKDHHIPRGSAIRFDERGWCEWVGFGDFTTIVHMADTEVQPDPEDRGFLPHVRLDEVKFHLEVGLASGKALALLGHHINGLLSGYSDDRRTRWQAMFKAWDPRLPVPRILFKDRHLHPDFSAWEKPYEPGDRPPMPERDPLAANVSGIALEEIATTRELSQQIRLRLDALSYDDEDRSATTQRHYLGPGVESDISEARLDATAELPITNAGPDAKANIVWSSKSRTTIVPEPPKSDSTDLDSKVHSEILAGDVAVAHEQHEGIAAASHPATNENPFHPDGPEVEEPFEYNTVHETLGSIFREELGIDEEIALQQWDDQIDAMQPEIVEISGESSHEQGEPMVTEAHHEVPHVSSLTHWFWGDLQTAEPDRDPVVAPREDRFIPAENHEIPPEANGHAAVPPIELPQPDIQHPGLAAQPGADLEQIEDDEGFEGLLELIGLQGPLLGLLQTSTFCTILVIATVASAIGVPYVLGKLALIILGRPVYYTFKLPLQLASWLADFTIDVLLTAGSWLLVLLMLGADFLFSAVEPWLPALKESRLTEVVSNFVLNTARTSAMRLQEILTVIDNIGHDPLLAASVEAHASLAVIKAESQAVLSFVASVVTCVVETISGGAVWTSVKSAVAMTWRVSQIPSSVAAAATATREYSRSAWSLTHMLRTGTLTFQNSETLVGPLLAYWPSSDRFLAVLLGYLAVAAIATVYVATDTTLSRSESGQRNERVLRDSLRQAGGVVKVILIISIEMLVFPLYCGLLLDLAFLPLFRGSSLATRWIFACDKPYTFCFVHWFVGTCYMFHFALFVGMCRKILRKGVLWFIRDPDDPTFHPVRDVLERNVTTQLRKIAFSALVYGGLVILCLGGVIWSIGHVFEDIFPIHWVAAEPVLEFPLDLFLYSAVTPFMIRLFRPSTALNVLYAWWLRHCARFLRLSNFLFGDRRHDEEGHFVRRTWSAFLLVKTVDRNSSHEHGSQVDSDVHWHHDGSYVLTPHSDQYRPPKAGEAFLYIDHDNAYVHDKFYTKNDHFEQVYIPPHFRLRVAFFMVCLWVFSAFLGLSCTLVPLVLGRRVFAAVLPGGPRVNDIYAYSVGVYSLVSAAYFAVYARRGTRYLREQGIPHVHLADWTEPIKRIASQVLKCAYVYGFSILGMPIVVGLLLQFYFILPLHTYVQSLPGPPVVPGQDSVSLASNATSAPTDGGLPAGQHTIHMLSNYCLGLVYARILLRLIGGGTAGRSLIAEAFRRITAEGIFRPDVRLATRFIVAPATLFAGVALLVPPAMAAAVMALPVSSHISMDPTKMYRYSFPLAMSAALVLLGVSGLSHATRRWRAIVLDEVYLVGERLHNFGENKPAKGGKLIIRH